jgi:hypothetical protein
MMERAAARLIMLGIAGFFIEWGASQMLDRILLLPGLADVAV